MPKTLALPLALISLLLVPAAASASTVGGKVRDRGSIEFGVITFKGAKGEANRVTATLDNGVRVFRDEANRLTATGDCEQVGRHTARCPFTEDFAVIRLGDKADQVQIEAGAIEVFGGSGDDEIHGSDRLDFLSGEGGNDEIHGGRGNDELTGGPGQDQVLGGSGDDRLIDGETDAQSAPDLYRGGSSRDTKFGRDSGDSLSYASRKRGLKIDLGERRSSTRDRILGLESIIGGSGNDVLSGDGDDNWLSGEGGDDRLNGRDGDDIVNGEGGDDTVDGGRGSDLLRGNSAFDKLSGGDGDDAILSDDSTAERVSCGRGEDLVESTRIDTLVECEISTRGSVYVKVHPVVSGDTAEFEVACQRLNGCDGTLRILGLGGEDYGSGAYADLPDDPQTFSTVTVQLTEAGALALAQGEVVQVTFGTKAGYKARI